MGPLVLTGLAALGSAVAIGLVVASTSNAWPEPTDRRAFSARSLAVISLSYCQGIAVLAAVAAILAVTLGGPVSLEQRVVAVGLAAAGALIGLAIIARNLDTVHRGLAAQGAVFISSVALLSLVVTLLATFLTPKVTTAIEGPFAILGLVAMAAALGLGITAAKAIRSMDGADATAAKALQGRFVVRALLLQVPGAGASVIAIVLIVKH